MKRIGIIVLIIGLVITLFTGFRYVTKEKVVDIGNLEITRDQNHTMAWSPLLGIAVILVGGGLFFFGSKKE
ncbi:MAG: LPXTG cell wall anchor domain-containing protein [Lewinellaceae bacterium]|nr:LPXTG cell wall anchor domain-containing protein [Lewinellaceae bacterium]